MSAIIRLAKSRPFAFGMGYSLLKTSGCDLMVQKVVEKFVEKPIEKIVYQDRVVEVPYEKVVYQDKVEVQPVDVEKVASNV